MKLKIKIALFTVIVIITGFVVYISLTNLEERKIIGIAKWTESEDYSTNIQGFKDGLNRMGFVEGANVVYLIESANANLSIQKKILQDFKDKKVDMVYSLTTPGTLIAKDEFTTIPIVFSIVTYPVDAGLIKNWYASENNLVGTSDHISIEKQFSFYSKIKSFTKIAFVHRKGDLDSDIQLQELKDYAFKNNIQVIEIAPTNLGDLKEQITRSINKVDAIYNSCDTLVQNGGEQITIHVATLNKKPSFSCNKEGAEEGALAADAADLYKLGFSSGQKAGFVLQGIKPESLISEIEADEFTIINLKTAQTLGLTVPEYLIYEATEVIK